MNKTQVKKNFAICIENRNCEDLDIGKVYKIRVDHKAESEGYLRIIDESGEDYLYPGNYFVFVNLPVKAQKALVDIS